MKDGESVLEETSSKLADGLKSCRAVVKNYRSLLAAEFSTEEGAERFSERGGEQAAIEPGEPGETDPPPIIPDSIQD